jgi:hypothetical protein
MEPSPNRPSRGSGGTIEAQARFRGFSERLAVRLRWLSCVAIPLLAYAADRPIDHPWFEGFVLVTAAYNLFVAGSLARGVESPSLSLGTALVDGALLLGLAATSRAWSRST